MSGRFTGKRVVITQSDRYMGEPLSTAFLEAGADVICDDSPLSSDSEVDALLERAGEFDVLCANFAEDPLPKPYTEVTDADVTVLYDSIVFPMVRTVRRVGQMMQARRRGKIIAVTSAGPLRGIPGYSAYCSARGAQNAFVRTVGLELAPHNVQFNAIAQNFVRNERYFPEEFVASEEFQKHWLPQIPTGALAEAEETAELALYLASEKCTHMVGQVIPWAGGWVTTTG